MTSDPTDGTDPATAQPAASDEAPITEPDPEHRDDGLDLARSARRAAGAVPGQPAARKKRRTTPYDAPRRRGGPRTSGAFPSDRDPQLVDTALERLISNHGWELDLRVQGGLRPLGRAGRLTRSPRTARPESFADTRLVVRTDSTAWATQLKLLAPHRRTTPQRPSSGTARSPSSTCSDRTCRAGRRAASPAVTVGDRATPTGERIRSDRAPRRNAVSGPPGRCRDRVRRP